MEHGVEMRGKAYRVARPA